MEAPATLEDQDVLHLNFNRTPSLPHLTNILSGVVSEVLLSKYLLNVLVLRLGLKVLFMLFPFTTVQRPLSVIDLKVRDFISGLDTCNIVEANLDGWKGLRLGVGTTKT